MERYSADKIRNIALLGHQGSGKTSLAEAMLYCTKAIDRLGRPQDGNTTLDFDPEEIKRVASISAAVASCEYKAVRSTLSTLPVILTSWVKRCRVSGSRIPVSL